MEWIDTIIFGHKVKISFDENSLHIYNAYPVKDNLKSRGYRWNSDQKSWFLTTRDSSLEIKELTGDQNPTGTEVVNVDTPVIRENKLNGLPESFSVLELRNRLDRLLKQSIQSRIWIRGVIASEVKDYKWASYFDLKDEEEKNDLFFRCEIRLTDKDLIVNKLKQHNVSDKLEKDLPVFFQVEVSVSNRYTVDFRLRIVDVLPEYTKSKLKSQIDITVDKLKGEGIFGNQKLLKLPSLIRNIGLITSEKGTSVKDVLAGLHPFKSKYNVYFIDSRMEGRNAVGSIVKSIGYFEKHRQDISLDVVVIVRGGGSEQSLAVFNDLELCRKVCKCKLPVITAIGHEKDISAIELCSVLTPTPSTPSGVGKLFQNIYLNLKEGLIKKTEFLIKYLENFNSRESIKVSSLCNALNIQFNNMIKKEYKGLFLSLNRYVQTGGFKIRQAFSELDNACHQVNSSVERIFSQKSPELLKLLRKIDFQQLEIHNINLVKEIRNKSRHCLEYSKRISKYHEKDLNSRFELIEANNPERILKKGFTLTLDNQNAVIKSYADFKREDCMKIRFYDGVTELIKKEIK